MNGEDTGALADNHGRRLSAHTIVLGALPPSLECPFPGPGLPQGFNGATVCGRALRTPGFWFAGINWSGLLGLIGKVYQD